MSIFEKLSQLFALHQSAVIFIPLVSSFLLILFLVIYRFFYPKRIIPPLILVLFISIPAVLNIFRPGTYQGGDLSIHAEYLRAFYQNLTFGIFVPRWAADFCAGNGCPVFLLSYVLPYYFGSLLHFVGFSYLDSIKIVLSLSFICSGIFMYLFIKEEINEKAGVIAAIFYLFSPYHLIDLHFRGSVGEVLSYVFIPLVFLFSKRLILKQTIPNFLYTTFSVILLLYSHSVTTVSVISLLIGYDIIVIKKNYPRIFTKQTFILVLSYITSILLSAYYWLPAFVESNHTWSARNGPADPIEPIQNYLYSPAGHGFLFQGNNAEYRLILGYPHEIVILALLFLLITKKKLFTPYIKSVLIFFLVVFLCYFLLMQTFTKSFWDYASFLNFFLMVWRLLVVLGFITAVIAGVVISKIKNTKIIIVICFLTIVSTMLNWGNRGMIAYDPKGYFTHVDEYTEYTIVGNPVYDKLYKKEVVHLTELGSLKNRSKYPLETISGDIIYRQIKRTPQLHEYIILVNNNAVIKENTFYFPGWKVIANDKDVSINFKNPKAFGKITFILPKGLYEIYIRFADTQIRSFADKISIFTMFLLVFMGIFFVISKKQNIYNKKRKRKKL